MNTPLPPKTVPKPPSDPRELCLICKRPKDPRRGGSVWNGNQEKGIMMVTFYLHDECRPVLENRRNGAK